MADNPLNAVNRGVYISDNLPFLQNVNDKCIDLVCIDPPSTNYEAGELMVNDTAELMNLTEAAQGTLDIYSARQARKQLPV
ncbi:MAG: hypothetical protein OXL37_03585 [Chloroflexota bacterium]|nr:hypothetical protein [Chloroflexota bacterium]MDE2958601.1 hypothetical protein [Chloroflexota bacterium]